MRTLYKNEDDCYWTFDIKDPSGNYILPQDCSLFNITLWTNDVSNGIKFTKDDFIDDTLFVDASSFKDVSDGPLSMKICVGVANSNYADGIYNQVFDTETLYDIKTPTPPTPPEKLIIEL